MLLDEFDDLVFLLMNVGKNLEIFCDIYRFVDIFWEFVMISFWGIEIYIFCYYWIIMFWEFVYNNLIWCYYLVYENLVLIVLVVWLKVKFLIYYY